MFLPKVDQLFIDSTTHVGTGAPKVGRKNANAFQDLKSIALSAGHTHFWNLINDFKNYPSLELIFTVVDETRARCGCYVKRMWGIEDQYGELVDSRLSSRDEILFEELNPSDLQAEKYLLPGVEQNASFWPGHSWVYLGTKDHRTMQLLVHMMRRGEGNELIAPHVRFVRVVRKRMTREEFAKQCEEEERRCFEDIITGAFQEV